MTTTFYQPGKLTLIIAGLLTFSVTASKAAEPTPTTGPATRPTAQPALQFIPRPDAPPAQREGGKVRLSTAEGLYVLALAPAKVVGTTTEEQPTLLWYISKPTRHEVEIRLTAVPAATTPPARPETHVFHLKHGVSLPGIQKLDLATAQDEHGNPARVARGVTYEWGVEVFVHAGGEDAADDPSSVVKLQRLDPPQAVSRAAQDGSRTALAQAYLEEGIWYDALGTLTAMIEAAPNDPAPREARRKMLEQQNYTESEQGMISD